MESNKNTLFFYLLFVFIIHVFPFDSSYKLNVMGSFQVRWDYIFHILVFIPLPIFLNRSSPYWVLISLVLTFFLEGIQLFLPYRSFNVIDILANLFGIIFGFLIIKLRLKLLK